VLYDKHAVRVRVSGVCVITFGDVLLRGIPQRKLAIHIYTDEADAFHLKNTEIGYSENIQSRECLRGFFSDGPKKNMKDT
jgi:acetate kinase